MKRKKFLLCVFLISFMVLPLRIEAKTLNDFRNELQALKEKKANQEHEKALTENEISSVSKKIESVTNKISDSEKTIKKLGDEIEKLNEEGKQRELEIKEVMHFLQIANGESSYLEYIFGAKDITDFIYRSAISGQLVAYNDKLIAEYNETIKQNEKKQGELKTEITNLDKQQKELEVSLASLGDELNKMTDVSLSTDEEIAAAEKNIKMYEDLGCKDNEEISQCTSKVPYSGGFVRPLTSGRITSNYGWRCYTRNNGSYYCGNHNGIDIAGGGTDVYAAAPGTVGAILWEQSCGGNMIFIHHNIAGTYYTTAYFHTKNIRINVGDYVDQNTIIATMGGTPDTWWYDKCTTGGHLHFAVARGLYMKDYIYFSEYEARNVDPTSVVNFPPYGVWFSNRVTKY